MVHDLGNQFEERNLFLHVALGLLSLSNHLDELLAATPAPAVATGIEGRSAPDPLVDLLLGLLSVSQTVRRHLDSAAGSRRVSQAPPDATPRTSGAALRRLLA